MLIWGSWRLLLSLCGGWVGFAESFSFPTQLLFWGRVVVGLLLGLSQFFHCNPRHSLSLFFLFIKGQKHKIWLETIKIALGRWCVFASVIWYASPDALHHCKSTLTLILWRHFNRKLWPGELLISKIWFYFTVQGSIKARRGWALVYIIHDVPFFSPGGFS